MRRFFGYVGRRGMCWEGVKCKREAILRLSLSWGDPGEARTHDPMIKSHLLYQLSHGVNLSCWSSGLFPDCECKITTFFRIDQIFPQLILSPMLFYDFLTNYYSTFPQLSIQTPYPTEKIMAKREK